MNIKKNILLNSNNVLLSYLRARYIDCRNAYLYLRRLPYINIIKKHIDKDVTIISSNCIAGRIMQDLNIKYNSPTLGLWMMPDDFPKFCSDLFFYLDADIHIVTQSKNELGNLKIKNATQPYPVGLLNGELEIHFLHYHDSEEAIQKWKRRAKRINKKKILLIASEQNGCTEDDIRAFDLIPHSNKIFFCSKPYPYNSVIYIPEFKKLGYVGDPYKKGYIYYKYLAEWLEHNSPLF